MNTDAVSVCAFESRRANEMAKLISKFGGNPTVAPSMQEVSLESQPDVDEFHEKLVADGIDITIFLTGVGTESLFEALSNRISEAELIKKIERTSVLVRGPKPLAVLAKHKIAADIRAPEPNTWAELVTEIETAKLELKGTTVAVQEYGAPSLELHDWLRERGATVLPVAIYRWELPDDIEPLRSAISATLVGQFDLFLWTSAQQIVHVLEVAAHMGVQEKWLQKATQATHTSIGPTASARLRESGIEPALEPTHPKMAHLVRESLEFVRQKRVT